MTNASAANAAVHRPLTCPPFDPARFERQLLVDSLSLWLVFALIFAAVLAGPLLTGQSSMGPMILAAVVAGAWVGISSLSTRVLQDLRTMPGMLELQPQAVEERLALHLKRWPLQKQVRLLLYHRLAMLRHRQQRFGEAAVICRHLLEHRIHPARGVRTHLLLILTEADLAGNNLHGAYDSLVKLGQGKLTLVESMQRLALQSRYELAVGQPQAVLKHAGKKIALAELMPAPQCGTLHAMFATAAERAGQGELAEWCRERAELLGEGGKAGKQESRKAENAGG